MNAIENVFCAPKIFNYYRFILCEQNIQRIESTRFGNKKNGILEKLLVFFFSFAGKINQNDIVVRQLNVHGVKYIFYISERFRKDKTQKLDCKSGTFSNGFN